jgi:hypothetical protein
LQRITASPARREGSEERNDCANGTTAEIRPPAMGGGG